MNEIVIPGLYLLSGICAYAAINHLSIALRRPRARVHLLFSGMCLSMIMFGLLQIRGYRAEAVVDFVPTFKWSIAVIMPFFVLFLWFVAEYTGVRLRPLLTGLSALFAVLFVVNLTQPYSLQFEDLQGLERLRLPWNETLSKPVGRLSVFFPFAVVLVLTTYGFALVALGSCYRRTRRPTILVMLLAVGLFVLASIEGILVRMSVINFIYLGPFGYLTLVIAMDVTLSYETRERLRASESRFRSLVEQSPFSVQILALDGRILFWNSASETMFGWRKDEAIGKTLDQLIHTPEEMAVFLDIYSEIQRTGKPNEPTEYTFRHRDGTPRTCISTIFGLPNVKGQPRFVCTYVDITERKRAEARIHQLAYQDGLTGLANRRSLQEHLGKSLEETRRSGRQGAMLLIDLDHFKTINDALGHNVGDEVLGAVALRLSGLTGEQGFLARLGGDEFVVVMENLPPNEVESARAADSLARAIGASLEAPIVLGERIFNVGASIGVALFQNGSITGQDVLRRADMALYRAKDLGRGNIQFFLPSLQAVADQRLRLERGLRTALANNELKLYFQPQVTALGQVFGAEALLRWRHPELGVVSPSKFIPVAEETGLIHSIGEWVLRRACDKLAAWSRAGTPFSGHLTVNLSPWQFARPDIVQSIRGLIAEQGIIPERLVLEVTESALLYDVHETIEKLAALRSVGLKVSLDDFGTGYSSLAYLKDLPLDILKIDKAFIDELGTGQKYPVVDTIITLGRNMNLTVIAEGVETAAQCDLLVNSGCNGFQGYLFCRPLPEDEFLRWLLTNTPAPIQGIDLA